MKIHPDWEDRLLLHPWKSLVTLQNAHELLPSQAASSAPILTFHDPFYPDAFKLRGVWFFSQKAWHCLSEHVQSLSGVKAENAEYWAVMPKDLEMWRVGIWLDEYDLRASDVLAQAWVSQGLTGAIFVTPEDRDKYTSVATILTARGPELFGKLAPIGIRPFGHYSKRPIIKTASHALNELQELLGQGLPVGYIEWVLRELPISGGPDNILETVVTNDHELLELNKYLREKDEIIWTREGGPWPHAFMAIADTGTGDYLALDLTRHPSRIIYYAHDIGDFSDVTDDLSSFYELIEP